MADWWKDEELVNQVVTEANGGNTAAQCEMARKCIRRAKRECALRYLILLLLYALGMVDKILFPQIEIKLSSYILLYVMCMFSMMGFCAAHNGIVAKRMKDFTLREKHDYNLVVYRENHNKKFPPIYDIICIIPYIKGKKGLSL